MRTWRATVKSQ